MRTEIMSYICREWHNRNSLFEHAIKVKEYKITKQRQINVNEHEKNLQYSLIPNKTKYTEIQKLT